MDVEDVPDEVTEFLDILFFLTVAVLLAFGSLQTAGTVLDTERPVVSVISCSMYPDLNVGDIIIVEGTGFSDIQEDDIVVFKVEKQVDVTVNGENVKLDEDNDSFSTSAGNLRLLDASSSNNDGGVAAFSLDGQEFKMEAGQSETINGVQIDLDYAAGMETPVIHRVTEKHETYLETKGDNNKNQIPFEKRIEPEDIYGVSQFKIPRIGGFKLLLMDFLGLNGGQPIVFDTYPVCQEET